MLGLGTLDLIIFCVYIIGIIIFGIWIANGEKTQTSSDYFLASKSLPWWIVGASLIASNISTEQILGMNGSGFELGMAIATYEMMAAATLLIVAKFFLPVFLDKGIYTMPQFLEKRYDNRVRTGMAIFWILLFVLVNITSVLYLGGLAIQSIMGVPLIYGIIGLILYSASFSIFGGLKAVVWTDFVQVIVLILGGLMASYFVLNAVGGSFFGGLAVLWEKAPERFDMIFEQGALYTDISTGQEKSAYSLLPGISVLAGGMWIANLYYWGNNQYIIQRALASKNLKEAQKGVAFAAFMKIFMPLIVVIPGIAAFVLNADLNKADEAFPWVLSNYVGIGFKGLVTAGLVAAIGSSISSMVNSASTIFTLDLYKQLKPNTSESGLVSTGKVAATIALLAGGLLAPRLDSLGQVFQYIQEYTGFISPGVVAIFIFGMFWKRTTANAALSVVLLSIPLSFSMQVFFPDFPFIDRMGLTFLLCSVLLISISLFEQKGKTNSVKDWSFRVGLIIALIIISTITGFKIWIEDGVNFFSTLFIGLSVVAFTLIYFERKSNDARSLEISPSLFITEKSFNILSSVVIIMLSLVYLFMW